MKCVVINYVKLLNTANNTKTLPVWLSITSISGIILLVKYN